MSEKQNTIIESLGVYLPPKEVSSKEIMKQCRQKLKYPMERLTGISSRHMAGDVEFAIDLAEKAIKMCLDRSKYTADEIELVICCNISRYDGPNFQFSFEPSTSVRLREQLGMPNALCFDISNACAGMFTGVHIADAFLQSGLVDKAVVVSGEYITHLTKTAQYEITDERDERMACLTLGDSGAAMVLERGKDNKTGFHQIDMYTLGEYSDCCIAKVTDSEAGGAIMLTDSLRIHAVAIGESVKHVVNMLKKVEWNKDNMQHFIMHQTARSAISELARQFNEFYREQVLDKTNMVYNVQNRGNTSTTTHFVAIWDNIINNKIQNGDSVLFAIQASGVTLGTAPYTFDDLPERLRDYEENGTKPANLTVVGDESQNEELNHRRGRRIRVESLGVIPDSEKALVPTNALALASSAAGNCFAHSKYNPNDIDLLIHSGVHRDEFLSEPAIAALLAGDLKTNAVVNADAERKTFAYDVINGSVSFLNACFNAAAMIKSNKAENALVVASEIENNTELRPDQLVGLMETGSAVIIDESDDQDGEGFISFHFKYFTDHIDKYYSFIGQGEGKSFLDINRDPKLLAFFIECIPEAVKSIMEESGMDPNKIKAILPPQISKEFVDELRGKLDFDPEIFVNVAGDKDYFTSSTAYAMHAAREQGFVEKGDIGLIINVGTGIQVAGAFYQF